MKFQSNWLIRHHHDQQSIATSPPSLLFHEQSYRYTRTLWISVVVHTKENWGEERERERLFSRNRSTGLCRPKRIVADCHADNARENDDATKASLYYIEELYNPCKAAQSNALVENWWRETPKNHGRTGLKCALSTSRSLAFARE